MNCNPWHVSAMCVVIIQPKSHKFRHSNVQGKNLEHESPRQIKLVALCAYNYSALIIVIILLGACFLDVYKLYL